MRTLQRGGGEEKRPSTADYETTSLEYGDDQDSILLGSRHKRRPCSDDNNVAMETAAHPSIEFDGSATRHGWW